MDIIQEGLDRAREELAHIRDGGIYRAAGRAGKRAMQHGKTTAVRIVREDYTIKASALRNDLNIKVNKNGELSMEMLSKGYVKKLSDFNFSPKRKGGRRPTRLTIQVKRGQGGTIRGAFYADAFPGVGSDGIYVRRGKHRRPLDEKFGPSVPQMLGTPENSGRIGTAIESKFLERLDHEVGNILGGITR